MRRGKGLEDSYLEKKGGGGGNDKVIVMKFSWLYKGLLDSFPHISLNLMDNFALEWYQRYV